jgi:hypothetical protein
VTFPLALQNTAADQALLNINDYRINARLEHLAAQAGDFKQRLCQLVLKACNFIFIDERYRQPVNAYDLALGTGQKIYNFLPSNQIKVSKVDDQAA